MGILAAFVTKKHAAPTELGQAIGEAAPIHMALLTELLALPTSSLAASKSRVRCCARGRVHPLTTYFTFVKILLDSLYKCRDSSRVHPNLCQRNALTSPKRSGR